MDRLAGGTAVITGGASGIGLAMAKAFADEGMRLVLADIEEAALDAAVASFTSRGVEAIGVPTDVSKAEQVETLAAAAYTAFGAVHVLCNNAGVGTGGASWAIPLKDWEWVLGVNLWGAIHGVRSFVPRMIESGEPGHVVNTASMAGLTSGPGMAPYNVSKHGVVTLSECLYHELRMVDAPIGVSVVCPGWVRTRINESGRNHPDGPVDVTQRDALAQSLHAMIDAALAAGLEPDEVAGLVRDAVKADRFYVLPHQAWKPLIAGRVDNIVQERPPEIILPEG